MSRKRIAVLGGGISGVYASHLLQADFDVTLFETESRLGGHAHSIDLEPGVRADLGFMVFNERSYPLLMKFLIELGLEKKIQFSEMSFSIFNESEGLSLCLNRGLGLLLHERRNLLRPSFYRLFTELFRLRKKARADLEKAMFPKQTLKQYLSSFDQKFVHELFVPIATSVWSVAPDQILDFPAETVMRFLSNHGYLHGHPGHQWRTLTGSSQIYLNAFQERFRGLIKCSTPIESAERTSNGVRVNGEIFDGAVCALPANRVLDVVKGPTDRERRLFSSWRYQTTDLTLHTDAKALGSKAFVRPELRSSWNVLRDSRGHSVSYYLNHVQSLRASRDYFVTLGSPARIDPAQVRYGTRFAHPVFDFKSTETQQELAQLGMQDGIAYCGSYFGYGFHEDAMGAAGMAARACSLHFSGRNLGFGAGSLGSAPAT